MTETQCQPSSGGEMGSLPEGQRGATSPERHRAVGTEASVRKAGGPWEKGGLTVGAVQQLRRQWGPDLASCRWSSTPHQTGLLGWS